MREEKFRCHPSIILEKTISVITVLFLLWFSSGDDISYLLEEGKVLNAMFIVLGIAGLICIIVMYNVVIWSKTYIEIEESTIVIQRNTIKSKINTYGIKNISNINLEQNILERILNTYKIKIDTDTSFTADSTDIEIVLSKKDAYEFKHKVIALINEEKIQGKYESMTNEANSEYIEETMDYDIVYSLTQILKHCFYSIAVEKLLFNLIILGATIILLYQGENTDITEMLLFGGMIVFSICSFFLGDLFKYYKLSIKREKDKLHISCGLFKKRKFTVPVNRINAINITQPPIGRMLKLYQSDIVTVGVGDDDSESSKIILSSNKEEFILSMKKLMPDINVEEVLQLEKQPKSCFLIYLLKGIFYMVGFTFLLFVLHKIFIEIPINLLILSGLGALILICVYTYLAYITKGIYLGEDSISMSVGIFTKKYSSVKYKKIQHVSLCENPISTKMNLCKGDIFILANLLNTVRSMGYYDKNLYEKLSNNVIKSK